MMDIYMMPYFMGVNSMCRLLVRRWLHFAQFIHSFNIAPLFGENRTAVCKGETLPKSKIHLSVLNAL
jgi:hypothetical protein